MTVLPTRIERRDGTRNEIFRKVGIKDLLIESGGKQPQYFVL
jgi:hypothetical protein